LGSHQVKSLGKCSLNKDISILFVIQLFNRVDDIALWKAVVDHISGIVIYSPSYSLLYLTFSLVTTSLSQTFFPLMLFNLAVSAPQLVFFSRMGALDLQSPVRALRLPAVYQVERTEDFPLWKMLGKTDTIRSAFNWHFLASDSLIDYGGSVVWGGDILLELLILAE
jgi:hypothetical protein